MSSKDASRYVKLLVSFPSLSVIVFVNLLLEFIISLFLLNTHPSATQVLILIFSPSLFSIIIYRIFIRKDEVFTLRRLLALQLVQELIYTVIIFTGWLAALLLHPGPYSPLFLLLSLGVALSSFISMIVMLGFLRKSIIHSLFISLLHVMLQSSRWLVLSIVATGTWINILLPLIISFFASLFFISFISLKWRGNVSTNPLKIFQSYLEYYFNKNPEPFEKVLEEASEKKNLELSLLLLNSKNGMDLSIFGVSAHFGPFGTIGSSSLPSRLINEFEKIGLKTVLLRNLSDHSLNLPSWREVEKVKEKMLEALNSAIDLEDYRVLVIQKEAEGYCVTLIYIRPYCIVLLSRPGYSTEDLPPKWLPLFSSTLSKRGIIPLIIADAHNSIDPSSWKTSDPDDGKFVGLLNNALDCLQKSSPESFKIGFNRVRPNALPGDEVGPGGISTIVFNAGGKNHAIIVIDGNNMVIGLRNYLVNNLKASLGLATLEIVTTDTHLLTGIKRSRKGYFPVGFKTRKELLLDYCKESINNAVANLSSCSAKAWTGRVDDVKVTGGFFETLEDLIKYCDRTIRVLFIVITSFTCLLLLTLL